MLVEPDYSDMTRADRSTYGIVTASHRDHVGFAANSRHPGPVPARYPWPARGVGVTLPLSRLSAAILVGGAGTRLRAEVPGRPKVLAEVLGRPFLAHLLDHLEAQGLRQAVLCTGHMGERTWNAVSAIATAGSGCAIPGSPCPWAPPVPSPWPWS